MTGLERFPESILQVYLGRVLTAMGQYEQAEAQFQISIAPYQSERVRSLGLEQLAKYYMYRGKYSAMLQLFDERIKIFLANKDENSAAESIAEKAYWMYMGWGDKDRVYKELERITQLTDVYNEIYFARLAATYALLGDFQQAEIAAEQVTSQLMKLHFESHKLLQERDCRQAISVNNILNNKWDATGRVLYGYFNALCYYEQGELKNAEEAIINAANPFLRNSPYVRPQSFLLLGKIYQKQGNTQRAIENYEKLLNLWNDADPDLPDLIDAQQRLASLKGASAK